MEISQYGEILKIKNYPDVLRKWEMIKLEIESTYKGEIVEKILYPMDKVLQNKDAIITSLGKDLFFFNYLMGIYGEYTNGKIAYKDLFWSMSDTSLKATKHNKLSLDDAGNINIEFSIEITPESLKQWQNRITESRGAGILDATVKGNCHFQSKDYIRSIDSCFEAYWNNQLFKRIDVHINLEEYVKG